MKINPFVEEQRPCVIFVTFSRSTHTIALTRLAALDLPVGVQVSEAQMTAPANVVVSARQNGPMMGQRGIVAHQTHRVGIGFGTVVVGVLNGDGGGWLGLVGLGGVGGVFGFGAVPNYRGAGTAASASTAATTAATATASISTSAATWHRLDRCMCVREGQLVLEAGRLLAARFTASFSPQPFCLFFIFTACGFPFLLHGATLILPTRTVSTLSSK